MGIGLVLGSAFLEFRFQPVLPVAELLGAAFGAGAALMLDEFALSPMQDVYWTDEGRASVNAVLLALLVGGLLVLATSPLEPAQPPRRRPDGSAPIDSRS